MKNNKDLAALQERIDQLEAELAAFYGGDLDTAEVEARRLLRQYVEESGPPATDPRPDPRTHPEYWTE